MTRRLLITLLCIGLPFALYALYAFVQARRGATGRDPWPVAVLWLTGAVMAIEVMVLSVLTEPGLTEPRYGPAALERPEAP